MMNIEVIKEQKITDKDEISCREHGTKKNTESATDFDDFLNDFPDSQISVGGRSTITDTLLVR